MTSPRRLATVATYDELIGAIRARVDELGISHAVLEDLAGLTGGHIGKLLGASQVKRIGLHTLWLLLEALGARLALEEAPEVMARMEHRWERREERRRRAGIIRKHIGPDVKRMVLREIGQRGGSKPKRFGLLHQQAAGQARWKRVTKTQRRVYARQIGILSAKARKARRAASRSATAAPSSGNGRRSRRRRRGLPNGGPAAAMSL